MIAALARRQRGWLAPAWAFIAGGGTGGHVVPAIAIGRALVERGHRAGRPSASSASRRGLERTLVPAAGFAVTLLPGRGIARRLTWRQRGCRRRAAGGRRPGRRPDRPAAAGGGGRGRRLRQRARARWPPSCGGSRSSWPSRTPRPAWPTGWPDGSPGVRRVVSRTPAAPGRGDRQPGPARDPGRRPGPARAGRGPGGARAARDRGSSRWPAVVAGRPGQPGRRINEAVLGLAVRTGRSDFEAAWPSVTCVGASGTGHRLRGRRRRPARPAGAAWCYRRSGFEDRMDLLLAAADVAVQRAGASTVSELAVVGPAVDAGAPARRPGGPPDCRTPAGSPRPGRPCWSPTPSWTPARLAAELDRLLGDEATPASRWPTRPGRWPSPTPPAAVAALAEEHARGLRRRPAAPVGRSACRPAGRPCRPGRPRRVHVVGVGRRGHERHRHRAGWPWATGSAAATPSTRPP